ncbi:PqiC family protein [Caballeronia sp. LZ062]|uniref:PqiC family protein n=1 Tax=unclassified Caballeronia TaxID=2646786 RepID=UPI00285D669F|nr:MULTISPECIES: PqiC family protein [unclassified Caballeronia]MDR5856816.1 PqiC family protein [Caballeronia sp. LZ050]MDR5869787.1 PqiC family protein [Caballeronia sp. LZ062]
MRPVLACLTLMLAVCAGCSSPRASFYRLSVDSSLTATTGRGPGRPLIVRPVTVPDLVNRPQIVTRNSDNEVALNEYARWGEPLNSSIADAIAGDLTLLLGSDRVAVASRAVADPQAWRVRVDIQQFESVPDQTVAIDARWAVRSFGGDTALSGRSVVREPVSGPDFDALVAAHSRALASVSRDIAAAIERSAQP